MGYVIPEIIIPLLIAALIGVFVGWLMWGWRRTRVTWSDWETLQTRAAGNSSQAMQAVAATGGDDSRTVLDLRQNIVDLEEQLAQMDIGDVPVGFLIKGNIDSMMYHRPDSRNYGATEAEAWFRNVDDAEAAGFRLAPTHPREPASSETAPGGTGTLLGDRHPYGAGSHAPMSDNSQPDGYPIKGNVDSMMYHRPDSRNYGATVAEVWFDTATSAEAAGFGLAPTHR